MLNKIIDIVKQAGGIYKSAGSDLALRTRDLPLILLQNMTN